ncbi:uncharacterized protein LOC129601706 isoform X2 [Paramacrobiotus metropolitanus]|nr:uncharacterized protein LOC129601706 isoform X2 [Paramacrobiotus metropolitanus]XP_055356548.1 uncharacterized protein LOC129601706 isoform X2 [Paramacrobiotus metropolitanus]
MAVESFSWNSVNVLGDDGLFRYGRVVDVADQGLYIDFLCPNRRREFAAFDRVFLLDDRRYWYSSDMVKEYPTPELPTQVLMREASGAWTWFPAELLIPARDIALAHYSTAVVYRGEPREYADVVPMARIRWKAPTDGRRPPPTALPRVGKWTFVKRSVKLPDGSPTELVKAAVKDRKNAVLMNYYFDWFAVKTVGVAVVDGCVEYIQRRSCAVTGPDGIHPAKELKIVKRFHDVLLNSVSLMPQPQARISISEEADAGVDVLSTDVWEEVFSHQDIMTQAKMRRVCATWNAILDSASLMANFVLDSAALTEADVYGDIKPVYFLISALFKNLNSSTQHVVVADRGRWMRERDIVEVCNTVNFIVQRSAGIMLKIVHLFGLNFRLLVSSYDDHLKSQCKPHQVPVSDDTSGASTSIMACRSLPCENIQLVHCTATFECVISTRYHRPDPLKLSAAFSVYRQRLTGDFRGALWSAMEAERAELSDEQMHRLSGWLTGLQARVQLTKQARRYLAMVRKTLCATQTADPRPSLHYRGKEWCVDGLQGLEVENLSRLGQDFLTQLMSVLPDCFLSP